LAKKLLYLSEEVNMKKTMIAIASLLLLSGAGWSDDMEMNANVKYYDNAKVVRVKSVEGEGFVQRSYDEGNEEATVNLALFEKDTVGTTDGRLAVYLGRLNYLRLDADSVVVLEKIPQLRKTDLTLRLEQGSVYLDIESLDQEKGIEVQTPDCGVFLLDKGIYRVNLDPEGRTEVIVLEGIAEVAGSDSSRNVRENQMIVMVRGEVDERPFYFNASAKDDFDRWNEAQNRELGYARFSPSRYLQSGYEDYEYEMSHAGRWSYMSEFNCYGWIPYYANSDWRPYDNGRWIWNPYYGYVWTSYDTCGWFTHHYGRWHWTYNLGWCWIPSYHWSPAWVSWFWNDSYYGWCPLSWWNRPIIIVNNRWDRHYDYRRGIPNHSRSTIIIRKNELSAANIHRVALSRTALGQNANGTIAYRGGAPTGRLAVNKVTVINALGKSVTYKQSGIVSLNKYRAQGSDIHDTVYRYDQASSGVASYRKKTVEGRAGESGRAVSSSRSSEESSGVSRKRYSSSASSSGKSSSKTIYRSKSGTTTRKTSSSSSSSSNGTVKKKKDGNSYYTSSRGGNSASGSNAAGESRYRSRSSVSGYNYRPSSNSNSSGSYRSSSSYRSSGSYRSSNTGTYFPGSKSSYRPSVSASSYFSRPYSSRSSTGSYSSSSSSRSSGSSGAYRSSASSSSSSSHRSGSYSGSSHSSHSSSSSSRSGGTAVKKK
jgi:hypothetical protein